MSEQGSTFLLFFESGLKVFRLGRDLATEPKSTLRVSPSNLNAIVTARDSDWGPNSDFPIYRANPEIWSILEKGCKAVPNHSRLAFTLGTPVATIRNHLAAADVIILGAVL